MVPTIDHPGLRPLPLRGLLRLRPAADAWYKPAVSAVLAVGLFNLLLLALGRLDLAVYSIAGGMISLYAHDRPYRARARALLWATLGMTATMAVAMAAAATGVPAAGLVAVCAVLAGAHKLAVDATRLGPPGNVILTFMAAGTAFLPQRAGDIPAHLLLVLAGAALAAVVQFAPALVRPHGPERLAVARALEAAAHLAAAPGPRTRHAAAQAVNAAWRTLRWASPAGRARLAPLVVRAEELDADAGRYAAWARELRRGPARGDVPAPATGPRPAPGTHPMLVAGPRRPLPAVLRPLLPVALRCALGAAVAGWASLALGVGRPYWAIVTAAAVFQANTVLSWHRVVQRAVGNLTGVLLFAALLPLARTTSLALVLLIAACHFGAEATISRNYWLGSTFVTPMALLLGDLTARHDGLPLVTDRVVDTVIGVTVGLAACVVVPNRRASHRVGDALDRLDRAVADGDRPRVLAATAELRDAVDIARGEFWQPPLPEERIEAADRAAHRVPAAAGGPAAPLPAGPGR